MEVWKTSNFALMLLIFFSFNKAFIIKFINAKKCKDLNETDIGYLLYIIRNKDDALENCQEEDKEKDSSVNKNEINDNINKK